MSFTKISVLLNITLIFMLVFNMVAFNKNTPSVNEVAKEATRMIEEKNKQSAPVVAVVEEVSSNAVNKNYKLNDYINLIGEIQNGRNLSLDEKKFLLNNMSNEIKHLEAIKSDPNSDYNKLMRQ